MRPLLLNRQSTARPITSPKKGLSRWSRQRRTTLTAPNTILGPGALILTTPGEPVPTSLPQAITVVAIAFTVVKTARQSQGETTSVRFSAAVSAASPVQLVPAGAESRDATERSRAGSRSVATRWQPAQADGGRSEGARPRLRARAASSRHSTMPRRTSAARCGFVTVGHPYRAPARQFPVSVCGPAGWRSPASAWASLTPVRTLPFGLRRTASSSNKTRIRFHKLKPPSR